MAVQPVKLFVELTKNKETYDKKVEIYVKDPAIWSSELRWVSLYPLGFYNHVLMEDGTVYKLNEFGSIQRELKHSKRGVKKRRSVTLAIKGEKPEQYFVHILLAWAFMSREETTSSTVQFKDENSDNISLDNLLWV